MQRAGSARQPDSWKADFLVLPFRAFATKALARLERGASVETFGSGCEKHFIGPNQSSGHGDWSRRCEKSEPTQKLDLKKARKRMALTE